MEKLVYLALASIPISGIVVGFITGAIGNLFGFDFWTVALFAGCMTSAFVAGQVFRG